MGALCEQPVCFESAGLQLRGMLGLPEAPEPRRRGIVLVHGWGGCRIGPHRMLVHAARRLLQAGFATLRFDLRGRGDSEGEADQTDLDGMIEDTVGAVDFLKQQPGVDRVGLLGICSGSNVAIGAATLRPEIRELALWSVLPFQPEQKARQRRRRMWYYLRHYVRKAMQIQTWRKLLRGDVNVRMVGKAVTGERKPVEGARNLKDSARDIMAPFGKFSGKALFITGTRDPEGLEGRELFTAFCRNKGIDATFHLIDGANHSYYARAHEEDVIERTLAWLLETTGRSAEEE